jgi:diguanylate cyclase (GGDEF)-like protein/putative nucleotidyltransferase with HDIG domain
MAQPVLGNHTKAGNVRGGTIRGYMALALVGIGLVFASSAFITFRQIREHGQYGRTINLAGRQRMLLEKITLEASAVHHGSTRQGPMLEQTEAEFDTSLENLRRGDDRLGIAAPTTDIRRALDGIAEQWLVFREQLHRVVAAPRGSVESDTALDVLLASSDPLLTEINRSVSLYEDALSNKVAATETNLIALAVLGALLSAAAWWFMLGKVARPLTKLADGAVRLGRGELGYRVPVDGVGEVGVAAREFNTMAERLERALATERERASHDALTGTLNHAAITDVLRAQLAESPAALAVCVADVDGMKAVNDTYGHQVGDTVIMAVARALSRDGATVGRFGGDEFIALLPGADRAQAERYCAAVAEQLSQAGLKDPLTGASVPAVASLGLAVYPDEARTADDLVQLADGGMYAAKRERPIAAGITLMRPLGGERAARMVGELVPLLTSPGDLSEKLRLVSHRLSIGAGYDAVHFEVFEMNSVAAFATNTFARLPRELIKAWNDEQHSAVGHPIGNLLRETRQPIIMDDPARDDRLTNTQRTLLAQAGLKSGLIVPLLWQDRVIGMLSVGSKREGVFSASDAQFLTAVANQVTAIIHMAGLVEQLQSASSRLARGQEETVFMLAATAEAHDRTTGRHLHQVRAISEALALELGCDAEAAHDLGMAAVLHDIGKIRVPDSILISPAQLSDEQWQAMKQHTAWGAELLTRREGFELAAEVARAHHERWDGSGYPAGLAGDDIPEAAAIVSVADSLDAMTSTRPYRPGRPLAWAVREIEANAGTQFSPRVVHALMRLHARGELADPCDQSRDDAAA